MQINILNLTEGARQAKGLTVIIDVFRAFTVEAFFAGCNAEKIIPVRTIEQAFEYKSKNPNILLCGERGGAKVDGFDFGNSPSQIEGKDFSGKTIVHTTSAGTLGIASATNADEILGGSLVNASAIAEYIKQRNPDVVSLVCMGLEGKKETDEDKLCAYYIKSILENAPLSDLNKRIEGLRSTDGAKFFDPEQQAVFPERDFHLSTSYDIFDFVLRLKNDTDTEPAYMEKIEIIR